MLIQIYYLSIKKLKNNILFFTFFKIKNFSKILYLIFAKYILCIVFKINYLHLILKKNEIINLMFKLKFFFKSLFTQLLDLIIVDRLEIKSNKKKRFSFTYVLLSLTNNIRIFINGFLGLFETLPSLYNLYKSAD
jgi:NADH:ubiquinone oxidoreductase subunit C